MAAVWTAARALVSRWVAAMTTSDSAAVIATRSSRLSSANGAAREKGSRSRTAATSVPTASTAEGVETSLWSMNKD